MTVKGILAQVAAAAGGAGILGGGLSLFGGAWWAVTIMALVGAVIGWVGFWAVVIASFKGD